MLFFSTYSKAKYKSRFIPFPCHIKSRSSSSFYRSAVKTGFKRPQDVGTVPWINTLLKHCLSYNCLLFRNICLKLHKRKKKFLPTISSRLNLRRLHFSRFSHVSVVSLKMILSCPNRWILVSAFVQLIFLVRSFSVKIYIFSFTFLRIQFEDKLKGSLILKITATIGG
jgi:hypothetical protein